MNTSSPDPSKSFRAPLGAFVGFVIAMIVTLWLFDVNTYLAAAIAFVAAVVSGLVTSRISWSGMQKR